jgi:3-hydroxyacyl-CoA dehydrogenase
MITTGDPINGREAAVVGLVDLLIEGDLVSGALTFAREVAEHRPLPRASRRTDRLAVAPALFEVVRAQVDKRARGAPAPRLAVAAVTASVVLDFEQGLERERELWAEAAASPESEAMRYVFKAERIAAKVPGLPDRAFAGRIRRAAVIGTGTMGTGIASAFANAGIDVLLVGKRHDRAQWAKKQIARRYFAAVQKRKLSAAERRSRLDRITATTAWSRLRQVDLAMETVVEDLDLKREILAKLEATCTPEAILASNTSSLRIDELASALSRPARLVGLHFFSPAHATKLLEIVRGERTSLSAIAVGMDLARQLGKFGVVVRGAGGPVSTRMFNRYQREAYHLLIEGALPHEIDAAMVGFGMALGPFATADLAGVDVGALVAKGCDAIAEQLIRGGRLGQKTDRGYYRYQEGDRSPIVDSDVEALVIDVSNALGIERRSIDESEIVERCVLAIVNEGATVLDERLAVRASDIDVIWVDGYGFPRHRGGPMYYADQIGLASVEERLRRWERRHGARWRSARLLRWLAGAGVGFGTNARTKEHPRAV